MNRTPHNNEPSLTRDLRDAAETIASLAQQAPAIERLCRAAIETLRAGGKILTAGNGGSAAEAMHMAEEFVGRFRSDRRALPCLALCADPTALTCIANDFGYDHAFSRQVEALGRPGDLLVLLSTSGRSPNIRLALETARKGGLRTACLLGKDGGAARGLAEIEIIVASDRTERIQEAHLVIVHLILDAVETAFAEPDRSAT